MPDVSGANELDEEFHINYKEYLGIIWRNKWGVIGLSLLMALVGGLSQSNVVPLYKAQVTLYAEPETPKFVNMGMYNGQSNIYYYYETQRQIIMSRTVAEIAARKLKSKSVTIKPVQVPASSLGFLESVQKLLDIEKSREQIEIITPRQVDLAADIQSGIDVEITEHSQIISLLYVSHDPDYAAEVANAVAEAYIEAELESRLYNAQQSIAWLNERLGTLRVQLMESESKLNTFQTAEGIVDSKSQDDILRRKLASITERLVSAQAQRFDAEIRYNQAQEFSDRGAGHESLALVLQNMLIMKLKEEESRLERKLVDLNERYGPKHPVMIRTKNDLAEAKQKIQEEIQKILNGIRHEYEVALQNEKSLMELYESTKDEVRNIKGKEFQLTKLERDVNTFQRLYDTFLTRFKEADIMGDSNITNIRIVDKAFPPDFPFNVRSRRIVEIWLAGGALLGVALAFLREQSNRTYKTKDDLERVLQLPVLGLVPSVDETVISNMIGGGKDGFSMNDPFMEAVKDIRTGIVLNNIDTPPQIIMVTSATPGEGKTCLSFELAFTFGQLGKTALVDLDLRKPRIGSLVGAGETPGLAEYLSGAASLKEVARVDPRNENVNYITSGMKSSNPLELISSNKFKQSIEGLREHYNYIIMDTPPVLLFSDALVISQTSDAVIMVIKAETTTFDMTRDCLRRMRLSGVRPFGTVLSQVRARRGVMTDGYYGYYYYDSYYSQQDAPPQDVKQ